MQKTNLKHLGNCCKSVINVKSLNIVENIVATLEITCFEHLLLLFAAEAQTYFTKLRKVLNELKKILDELVQTRRMNELYTSCIKCRIT